MKQDINYEARVENATNAIAKWVLSDSEEDLAQWLGWSADEFLQFLTRKMVPDRMLRARD